MWKMEQKLLLNKKGQALSKGVNTAVIIIVSIVILFQLFASLVPEAQSAGDEFSDATRCGDSGGNFNVSQALCLNGTNPEDTFVVSFEAVPLSSLFGSSGIIILLLLVFLLLAVIKIAMPKR